MNNYQFKVGDRFFVCRNAWKNKMGYSLPLSCQCSGVIIDLSFDSVYVYVKMETFPSIEFIHIDIIVPYN